MSTTEEQPVSLGDWIITLILVAIPLVNIIMLIVWAVGESTHPSKRNYARAMLIFIGLFIVLGIGGGIVGGVLHHH